MEQVTQVDRVLKQLLGLDELQPLDQGNGLPVNRDDPFVRTLRSLPGLFPICGHLTLHQVSRFSLTLVSQHLVALQDVLDGSQAFVHSMQDALDRQ